MKNILSAICFALFITGAGANSLVLVPGSGAPPPPTPIVADGYFSSVNGLSSNDCSTYTQGAGNVGPCTVGKIPAFMAANVATKPNMVLALDPAAPLYLGSTPILITPAQAPNTGTITFDSYYGQTGAKFDLDAGVDMYGTGSNWTNTTTINGHTVCVWNGYQSQAPLTRNLVPMIPRMIWVNGGLRNWITVPRIGYGWASIPGNQGDPTAATNFVTGSNVTFSSSTPNMVVNDQTQIGVAGDTVLFASSPASNISGGAAKNYYIASSPAIQYDTPSPGMATFQVTVNGPQSQGGSIITPNTSGTAALSGYPQSGSTGDRLATQSGLNKFPYDATNGNPVVSGIAAGDQQGVRILFPYSNVLAPVYEVNNGGSNVTLTTQSQFLPGMFPKQAYQVINNGAHLAENDGTTGLEYTGEWYFNPSTGLGYYTPRVDLGENCANINQPGVAIAPGTLTNALRISDAVADNAATSGQFVGGLLFKNGSVQHTNSSLYTGQHTPDGSWGGGFGSAVASVNGGQFRSAVELVGARNVQIGTKCTAQTGAQCTAGNGLDILHSGGNGIEMGCGSSGDALQYTQIKDFAGSGITKGMQLSQVNAYICPTDATGGMQTNKFGPSTGTFNQGGSANLPDLTGYHDCCNTVSNNWIDTGGTAGAAATGSAMIGDSGDQMDLEVHNLWQNAPYFGYSGLNSVNGNTFPWLSQAGAGGPFPVWGRTSGFNLGKNFNYRPVQAAGGTVAAGTPVPGTGGGQDFGPLYRFGSGDGPGDGSLPGFALIQNAMYDQTTGQAPEVPSQSGFTANGYDAVGDYSDNYSCGGYEFGNIFLTRSSAAVGFPSFLTRITQHADVCRSYYANNIYAATWPSGWNATNGNGSNGYAVRNDTTTGNTEWFPSRNYNCGTICYVFSNKNYYGWVGNATTGATTATMPGCTGTPGVTTCPIDGGVTWIYEGPLPLGQYGMHAYQDVSNITAYAVTSATGTSSDPVAAPGLAGFVTTYPQAGQFAQFANNLYSKAGVGMSIDANSPTVSFSTFKTTAGPTGVNQELNTLWGSASSPDAVGIGPNFVNLGTGDTRFNSSQIDPGTGTACGNGLGVSPECGNGFDARVIADTTAYAGPVAATSTWRTFTPLAQYYISPTGNDGNNGLTPATAWATPNHAVHCGDVITAVSGTYGSGATLWQTQPTVTACPSTTGGIDGGGGIYSVIVDCQTPFTCNASSPNNGLFAFKVVTSNVTIRGWNMTSAHTDAGCAVAVPLSTSNIDHIAFINNVCNGAVSQGFGSSANGGNLTGVDYTADVGNIAYNAAQGTDLCYSGFSHYEPRPVDTVMGTHIFVSGNFAWGNTGASCQGGLNTDHNGLILDDFIGTQNGFGTPYTGKTVVKNNIFFDNYGSGISVGGNGTSAAPIQIYQNTSYGNGQNTISGLGIPDLFLATVTGTNTGTGSTEISWPKVSAWYNFFNPTVYAYTVTGGGTGSGTTQYVSAVQVYNSSIAASVTNNVIFNSGTGSGGPSSTLFNNTPQAPNFAVGANGNMTSAAPGFASPPAHGAITAPDCSTGSPTLVNQCATVQTIVADFKSKAFPGIGYQPPHTYCVADQDFPRWLKGVIPTGLIDLPCGM